MWIIQCGLYLMLRRTESYDEIAFNKYKRGLRIWANQFCGRGVLPQEMKTHVRKMTQLSYLGEFKGRPRKRPSGTKGVTKMMNEVVGNKSRMTTQRS